MVVKTLRVIIFICLTSNIVELVPSRILKKVKVLDNERPYMTISTNDKVAILFEIDRREGVFLFLLMFYLQRSRVSTRWFALFQARLGAKGKFMPIPRFT